MRLFVAYLAAFVAFGLATWIDRTFGEPSIDQIAFHLLYAEHTAMKMGSIFIQTFLVEVLAFPLLFAVGATSLHALILRWRPHWHGSLVMRAAPRLAVLAGLIALPAQFSAFSYVRDSFGPDLFSRDYVEPRDVRLQAGGTTQKNLILIYMESIEETYANEEVFGSDLLAPLHTLKGAASFQNYQSAPGTNWTIGAIVGTQCGVPLRAYSEGDIRRRESGRSFLRGATCLGDILEARGYRNVFLGGAPLSFSGKGAFLHDHGYAVAYGRDEWTKMGAAAGDMNEWGLYDGVMFRHAREQLKSLHDARVPFSLTLLTMNTHNPSGFLGKGCRDRGVRDFEGIVNCSATQVRDFVEFARQGGYLDDTVVVILGDHLAVPNPVWDKLRQAPERKILNVFLDREARTPERANLLPFDLFPSILELMGFQVAGGRLALGYAGFGHPGLEVPPGRNEAVTTSSLRSSRRYHELWEPSGVSPRPDP